MLRSTYYKLDGKKAVEVENLQEWAMWFETAKRHVADETVNGKRISTVFLGLDHNYGEGAPLLFETMIFDKEKGFVEDYCERYETWEEAEKGHARAVEMVKVKK